MNLKEILTKHIYRGSLDEINLEGKVIINTLNPHSYCIAKNDRIFQDALLQCDYLLPDGEGISLASRVLLKKELKKIAGADIHQYLLNKAQLNGERVFYLGSSNSTLSMIRKKLLVEFPKIKVGSYSPKYKDEFTELECEEMINAVNDFGASVLFVGMTAPKQEKWVFINKANINAKKIVSIGAVFDFYSETKLRPNKFWINLRLEWFIRFLREPKRLWKRNFISTPIFLYDLILEKLKINRE